MKYIIILISVFYISICEGADLTIHALLLSDDTPDSGLREEVHIDINKVRKLLTTVSKQTKLGLKLTVLQGENATFSKITGWIDSLPQSSKNIIFVYFAGHGFRPPLLSDQWPYLVLPDRSKPINSNWLAEKLENKRARLSILLSDCCNITDERFISKRWKGARREESLPGLKKLFLEATGSIIGSAASPGEFAFCSLKQGGIFTDYLLSSLYRACQKKSPSWREVFLQTRSLCSPLQTPIFLLKNPRKEKREPNGQGNERAKRSCHDNSKR